MKKRNVLIIIVVVAIISAALIITIGRITGSKEISLKGAELIYESFECPNEMYVEKEEDKVKQTVQIYQRADNTVIVNYNSNFAGFRGKSDNKAINGKYYTVSCNDRISEDDVNVDWQNLNGSQEESKDNTKVFAEITISEGGRVIDDRRVNFISGAIEAVIDSMEQNKK